MFRNKSVDVHRFAMTPRADIPRSSFLIEKAHKTTFDGGYLVPVLVEEVLPGDTINMKMTAFARLATPLFPLMDNLHLDWFFFFVPNRLVWSNWVKFMGEQLNPGDSISFTVPQQVSPAGGYAVGSLQDYFGLPTAGQVGGGNTVSHSALPLRAYNLIWREWFRDENLQNSPTVDTGDGPDTVGNYVLLRRGKRHDYFTSALPWPQKGNTAVSLPLGTTATVRTNATELFTGAASAMQFRTTAGGNPGTGLLQNDGTDLLGVQAGGQGAVVSNLYPSNLYADLSTATAATINDLREAFQTQRLLERDARGGTRYTEIVQSHFGVVSPDARLQRPEYLGGSTANINVHPVPQQSASGATGTTTKMGDLAGFATASGSGHGFKKSFTEHCVLIGLVSVQADLNYQQGLNRMFSRRERYDFYWPALAHLGEQAVLKKEIFANNDSHDDEVWGYQERFAEYRYKPSVITGEFRSTYATSLDSWHLAQEFGSVPSLNAAFIVDTPPMDRVKAVTTAPDFIFDSYFHLKCARPMPVYSVPGLIDHF